MKDRNLYFRALVLALVCLVSGSSQCMVSGYEGLIATFSKKGGDFNRLTSLSNDEIVAFAKYVVTQYLSGAVTSQQFSLLKFNILQALTLKANFGAPAQRSASRTIRKELTLAFDAAMNRSQREEDALGDISAMFDRAETEAALVDAQKRISKSGRKAVEELEALITRNVGAEWSAEAAREMREEAQAKADAEL